MKLSKKSPRKVDQVRLGIFAPVGNYALITRLQNQIACKEFIISLRFRVRIWQKDELIREKDAQLQTKDAVIQEKDALIKKLQEELQKHKEQS